ncbi:MAG: hypothetical protein ABL994_23900, partial [Verrucomicrobiales bacterium]
TFSDKAITRTLLFYFVVALSILDGRNACKSFCILTLREEATDGTTISAISDDTLVADRPEKSSLAFPRSPELPALPSPSFGRIPVLPEQRQTYPVQGGLDQTRPPPEACPT